MQSGEAPPFRDLRRDVAIVGDEVELIGERGGETPCPPHDQLSDREFQVFLQLARGKTIGRLADHLALSVKTVSTYRSRVMDKLGLSSNSELTYYALKNGLMQ